MLVVDFLDEDIVFGIIIHYLSEVFIETEEDINADTEIGSIEHGLIFLFTNSFQFIDMGMPSCSANHHRDVGFEAL